METNQLTQQLTIGELDEIIASVGLPAWGLYNVLVARGGNVVFTELEAMFGVTSKTLRTYFSKLKSVNLVDLVGKTVIFTTSTFFTTPSIVYTVLKSLKDIKELETVKKAANTSLAYWCAEYEKRYAVKYVASNWARDQRSLKLLDAKYGERLRPIIEIVMRLYETRWYSQSYPRPTIGAMVSWLAAQADGFVTLPTESSPITVTDNDVSLDDFDAKFGLARGGAYDGS